MKKFEEGKKYYGRSIYDSNCKYEIEVIARGNRYLKYINEDGDTRKSIIRVDEEGNEYIRPDSYIMAPIFRAEREVK